jgi:hypothetical protein
MPARQFETIPGNNRRASYYWSKIKETRDWSCFVALVDAETECNINVAMLDVAMLKVFATLLLTN